MAKFTDWESGKVVQDIMESFLEKFPNLFPGFDTNGINFVMTKKKKSREPIKLRTVGYPVDVFVGKPYIVEVFQQWWKDMTQKQKNLAVFHVMCAIPEGAFDEQSKHYGKKLRPDIEMYLTEFAAAGGIPNWMENPAAADPMETTEDKVHESMPRIEAIPPEGEEVERNPVTVDDVATVGQEEERKSA